MMNSSDSDDSVTSVNENSVTSTNVTSLINKAQKKAKQNHLSSVTAFTRAKKMGNEFYEDKGVLFCRVCVKAIDHKSLSVIKRHQNSEKHKNNLISSSNRKRPLTLTTSFAVQNAAKLQNIDTVQSWIRACVASNIPLNVSDNLIMRNFFQSHITSGGSIPRRKALQPYLNDCYKCDREKLKQKCKGKTVMIFYDETFDAQSRHVSCVLLALLPPDNTEIQPYLAEVFLDKEPVNSSKVAQQIVTVLSDYGISFDKVASYGTDNASYMLASFQRSLKEILPNCFHLPCIAHIFNLVVKEFMKSFSISTDWASKIAAYFSHSGARKILDRNIRCSENSKQILDSNYKFIVWECTFIRTRARPFIDAIRLFESDLPLGCISLPYLENVFFEIVSQKELLADSLTEILDQITETFTSSEQLELIRKISTAALSAESKYLKYFGENGCFPGLQYFKDVQFLVPSKSLSFSVTPKSLKIPGISKVPEAEFLHYRAKARTFVSSPAGDTFESLKAEIQQVLDFWMSVSDELPNLATIAKTYCFLLPSSASVERVFSYYNKLLTDERQTLSNDSIRELLFLYVNSTRF